MTGGRGIMHPMFVKLFLEPDADDLQAEEEALRRSARRARRTRRTIMVKSIARDRTRISAR
jgi:hypothetical protein